MKIVYDPKDHRIIGENLYIKKSSCDLETGDTFCFRLSAHMFFNYEAFDFENILEVYKEDGEYLVCKKLL